MTHLIKTFQLHYNGIELNKLINLNEEINQIIRICNTNKYLFLLSDNYNLYYSNHPPNIDTKEIQLNLWKRNIIDIEINFNTIYLVNTDGIVNKMNLNDYDINDDMEDDQNKWTKICFNNSNENDENYDHDNDDDDDIKITRIKCNSIGCIYLTKNYEIYGDGKFNDDIKMVKNLNGPSKLNLNFYPQQCVIDICCGENFFIILTQLEMNNQNETDDETLIKLKTNPNSNTNNKLQQKIKDLVNDSKNNSKDSLISSDRLSSSTATTTNSELNLKIQEIIKNGFCLINTNVYSFGNENNGLLGTGDHIKRNKFNDVLNLNCIGCYSISCGHEHSLARTIDGRIFYWGLNSQQQINSNKNIKDITSPKELNFNENNVDSNILDSYCNEFQTILLSNDLQIYENSIKKNLIKENLEIGKNVLRLHSMSERNLSIILSIDKYILINQYNFMKNYYEYFNSMQLTIQKLLKNLHYVKFLKYKNNQNDHLANSTKNDEKFQIITNNYGEYIKFIKPLNQGYYKILYCLTSCCKSVENFYRNKINYTELLFIKSSKELIQIFNEYTKFYCDIISINGFKNLNQILELNLIGNNSKFDDYEKISIIPFVQINNILKFIEILINDKNVIKTTNELIELNEILFEWNELSRKNCIEIELAEHTKEFWLKNSKNAQIKLFKKSTRRVILDSTNVPLKLLTSSAFSTNSFILFSDCLCQYGSNLQTFPLIAMWLLIESEFGIRIFTPEKSFVIIAKNHEHKMLWYDQLKSTILTSLNKLIDSQLSDYRITAYMFSDKHEIYSNVRAYGRWRLGILHGSNCYLEYPDGKIYYGNIKNNQINGNGKMIIPQIGIYDGNFVNGKFNGYGYYEMKDNEIYDGNFRDGQFHGHGILRTNFYTYVGEFIGNMKNGYGIYDDMQNGEKYMGMFAENKRIGPGTCISMNGDYFEGFFINDEISGDGLAIFENGYYYVGDMKMKGPNGKGSYYMPINEILNYNNDDDDDDSDETKPQMLGNIITGNLSGNWNEVRVISGTVLLNKKFDKFPSSIGDLVVDNNRKWRSLFDNWEEEIFDNKKLNGTTKDLWNKIAFYMTKKKFKSDNITTKNDNSNNYFAKNITLQTNYDNLQFMTLSNSFDKISMKSTTSLFTKKNSNDHLDGYFNLDHRKSCSNDQLFEKSNNKSDKNYEKYFINDSDLNSFINFQQQYCNSTRTSIESTNSINSFDNNNLTHLEFFPNFGITSLNGEDFEQIKEYLGQAFKHPHHPLSLLNQRISTCFYNSYGCWKVKPTTILAYQAIKEWESISKRVYNIVRKLFPALPEMFCEIEGYREIISHISLLYPIVLSEGIYSTLFVLYANKFSEKDELYRQRIMTIEKKSNEELAEFLTMDKALLDIIINDKFQQSIQTLKQVTEEYSPKGMLDVIEKSMQLISEAHSNVSESTVILAADNMIPLTLFLIIRANVPHLGAELELLDELTGEENCELNMSGLPGYCYTTIKAAYEHIINGNLFKN